MINAMKKLNPYLLAFLTGAAFWFSVMSYMLSVVGAAALMTGTNYVSALVTTTVITVLFYALIAKLLVRVAFRIVGGIFTRKSGMLYPFPIRFGEFTGVVLSFAFICFLIGGIICLPLLFFPTLSTVLGAVRTLTIWVFLFIGTRYFIVHYTHDYDRKALAVALSVIPFVLVGLTLLLTIWGLTA